jgi:hypothetical protein
MSLEMLSPRVWAQRQFGEVELGDKRRTKRAVEYAAAAAAGPSLSVPEQCGGRWKRTKGAYRLFGQEQVSFEKVQAPHRRLVRQAAAACPVVLWVSDTSTLSFGHPATAGLGPTAGKGQGRGMLLHSTLGLDVSGGTDAPPIVLGLGHQQVWARGEENDPPQPESRKWQLALEAIGSPPPGSRQIHVADAESDCWEAIESAIGLGMSFVTRACQDRVVRIGHDDATSGASIEEPADRSKLFEALESEPALGNAKFWARSRPNREAGWVILAVSALPVTLLAPQNWPDKPHRQGKPRPEPIRCWAVRVYQINTPAGQEPIEWVLLTDEPVTNLKSALKVAFWYSCRWLIEEYHKCLKSGCRVERRQLQEASRLQSLLGILAVVAVRLLQLKHQAKVNPTAKATSVVPKSYVQTLAAYLKQRARQMTTHTFWIETARLGGFLARKGDGDPGWQTLWHGWQKLEAMTLGFELAHQS